VTGLGQRAPFVSQSAPLGFNSGHPVFFGRCRAIYWRMRADVEKLLKAWQDAWFAKDGGAIAEMMADDYGYVAPNGAVMDRAAMVRRRWQGSGT